MADSKGTAVDTVTAVVPAKDAPVIPEGYWLGGAGAREAYWRRRAETAEARCRMLEGEIRAAKKP